MATSEEMLNAVCRTVRDELPDFLPCGRIFSTMPSAPSPLPPRVSGLPLIGNTLAFIRDTSRLLNESYIKHGAVFRLRALWLKYTVIGGFEARRFQQEGLADKYLSRHKIFDQVGLQLGSADFVLAQTGESHTRLRRLLGIAYSREVASPFVPQFVSATRGVISGYKPGDVLSVFSVVKRIAFEQYCQVMCGRSLGQHYKDVLTVTEYNMNIGGRVWPFFLYQAPWYQSARKRVLETMWGLVRERPSQPNPAAPATIMDTLLHLRDKGGDSLTADEVVCYSMYGFAGSASYMARLVAFMLYEILKHPDLQHRLVEEVDHAFSSGLQNAADVRRMELLCAVYNETLRFHPVSQGMPFYADQDFVYEGRKICAGDITVLSQVPMSFSRTCFSEPNRFDPERMLSPRREHRKGGAFHPYGIGHRTCTAMGLVELMAVSMVATLLRECRIEMSPPCYQLRLTVRPLPAPNNRFGIKVAPRQAVAEESSKPLLSEEGVTATFSGHDDPTVHKILENALRRSFANGAAIVRQGDTAEAFYIIERGEVKVTRLSGDREELLAQLFAGQYFGEIGILLGVPRTATVTAASDSVEVLELSRDNFMQLIRQSDLVSSEIAAIARKRTAENCLREALPLLSAESIQRILPEFKTESWSAGTLVIQEGDPAERFYIISEGIMVVSRRTSATGSEELARLGVGQYFGEIGLLTGGPRNASVAVSDQGPAKLISIDRQGFQTILDAGGGVAQDLAETMLRRMRAL